MMSNQTIFVEKQVFVKSHLVHTVVVANIMYYFYFAKRYITTTSTFLE
jgi:hypothetical protein